MSDIPASSSALMDTPPAAAPAPAPAAAPAAAPAPAPAAGGITWLEGASSELIGYAQNKGWESPKALLESYQNLERMRGVPAERLLTLPDDKSDQATRDAFYERLGRPKEAAGYEFELAGKDSPLDTALKQSFHQHGLTAAQAKGVIEDYKAVEQAATKQQQEAAATKVQTEHQQLMTEWGAAGPQNLQLAKRGAELLGFSNDDVDKLGATLGHARTMKLLQSVTARSGEADFVTGQGGERGNGAMTPAQAQAKLAELRRNPEWAKKALNPGTPERAEMQRLIGFQTAGR